MWMAGGFHLAPSVLWKQAQPGHRIQIPSADACDQLYYYTPRTRIQQSLGNEEKPR